MARLAATACWNSHITTNNNDNTHGDTNIIITTTKGSSHPSWMQLNCMTSPPSCASPDSNSSCSHRHSSQRRWFNCKSSSGLLAGTDPARPIAPHEWRLRRGNTREVMSPRCDTRAAKLSCSETSVDQCRSRGLSTDARASPERLVAEYGTRSLGCYMQSRPMASGFRGGPATKGAWLLPAQVEVTQVERANPGSIKVSPVPPQDQRCGGHEQGACHDPSVVAPHHASQNFGSQKRRSAAWMGNRRPVQTSTLHPDCRGVGFEGGLKQYLPRSLVNSGDEASLSGAPPTLQARLPDRPLASVNPPQNCPAGKVPKGYTVYMKKRQVEPATPKAMKKAMKGKKDEKEVVAKPLSCPNGKWIGGTGECQKEC